jgi:hypothetical protein
VERGESHDVVVMDNHCEIANCEWSIGTGATLRLSHSRPSFWLEKYQGLQPRASHSA